MPFRTRRQTARTILPATVNAEAEPAEPARPQNAAPDGETDETVTGTVREPTIDSADEQLLDEGAPAADPIQGLDPDPETNPLRAAGHPGLGSFILRPSIEQGLTATTNADNSVNGTSALLSETTLRLNAVSDCGSRHSATINAFGNFREFLSDYDLDEDGGAGAWTRSSISISGRSSRGIGYAELFPGSRRPRRRRL